MDVGRAPCPRALGACGTSTGGMFPGTFGTCMFELTRRFCTRGKLLKLVALTFLYAFSEGGTSAVAAFDMCVT